MTRTPGFYITSGKGFHVVFANGWTVSVQFGAGNYCRHHDCEIAVPREAARCEWGPQGCGANGSPDAEVAVFGPDGAPGMRHGLMDFGEDTVRGWQTPAAVLALLNAAANGDLAAGKIPAEERSER